MATRTDGVIGVSAVRIPELDGIRGLAILLVIFYHVFVAVPAKSSFFNGVAWIFGYAWSGVDLFFVLSGFLIGGILLDCQGKRQWGVTFYARRFLRIFPLYYGWLFTIAVVTFLLDQSGASQSWKDLFRWEMPPWMFPAFLQNFWLAQHRKFITPVLNATWSLAVEEQFYLVLPAIIYLAPRRRLAWVMGGAAVCAFALRTYSFYAQNHIAPYVLLACRADTFTAGVLLALLFRRPEWLGWVRKRIHLVRGAFGLAGVAVAFMTWRRSPHWDIMFGYSGLAVFYALLILLVLTSRGFVSRWFRASWIQYVGRRAYGLYMFHTALIWTFHQMLRGSTAAATDAWSVSVSLFAVALAFVAAEVSWRLMESPLIEFGQSRFRYMSRLAKDPQILVR